MFIKDYVKYRILRRDIPYMIHVVRKAGKSEYMFGHGFQSRQENTIAFIKEIFEEYEDQTRNKKFDFYIWTDDCPKDAEYFRRILGKKYIFAYSTEEQYERVISIPDFIYTSWKEVGIENWEELIRKCAMRAKDSYKDKRAFWIGNTETHSSREELIKISEANSELILAEGMQWLNSTTGTKQQATKYVSLFDHADYKYLIDIQGRGYSGRLKILFHLGRPVVIIARNYIDFFSNELVDMENCILVKEDMSDLVDKIQYVESRPELYQKIVDGAYDMASRCLTKEAAKKYMLDVILKYGN